MHTLLDKMEGTLCSRQAQNYVSTAVQEAMDVFVPITESPDGEGHFFSVKDMFTMVMPRYFVEVCQKIINPRATRFLLPTPETPEAPKTRYVPEFTPFRIYHVFSN